MARSGPDPITRPPPPTPAGGRAIDRAKYDAIHRALLAGLLSNVGQKTETHEYTGARGRKFHLFPGSGLFSRKPPWVMAAELAETTRLYARTVARIDPMWIERVGEHLVNRQYTEPHWSRDSAHVYAFERVTLYGLVIVARRRVHYGPIDPKTSREIFIREALVNGEYNTDAPYFRHNKQLVRDVELMEAKLRRRDLLVDAQTRFAFYDARIPAGIYNGPLFEKWRRQAEARDRRALFMSKEDLMLPVPEPPKDQFPEAVLVDEMRFPLTYRFDPGHAADGVTATVPLGVLNRLDAEPFEWLVPGWLEEKAVALIKSLPRELRVALVPVPDTVRAVLPLLKFGEGSLPGQLAWHIGRVSGVQIPPTAWDLNALPDWLRLNFRIVDEAGKTLEAGRDLDEIRRKLRVEVKQTFENLPTGEWHRDNLTRWDFGDLPEQVEVKRPGITLKGYPALVDTGTAVNLRLLDTAEAAAVAMRAGVRRLFMLQVGQQMKYLARNLPGVDRMCLFYATLGPCEDLKRDLVNLTVDRAMYDDAPPDAPPIRTQEAFAALAEAGWRRLSAAALEICDLVGQVLALHHDLTRQLSAPVPPMLSAAVADMREQLAHLVYRGFVAATPFPWLRQYPRFLKAIEQRRRKLVNAGAARDAQAMMDVRPLWEQYLKRAEWQRLQGISDPALRQYRWMLEELRVSLFAQELKTSVPVSVKRLQGLWAEVKG
jgi:ATP-dependent helicase HrpA